MLLENDNFRCNYWYNHASIPSEYITSTFLFSFRCISLASGFLFSHGSNYVFGYVDGNGRLV